jgi:hypothetical protein
LKTENLSGSRGSWIQDGFKRVLFPINLVQQSISHLHSFELPFCLTFPPIGPSLLGLCHHPREPWGRFIQLVFCQPLSKQKRVPPGKRQQKDPHATSAPADGVRCASLLQGTARFEREEPEIGRRTKQRRTVHHLLLPPRYHHLTRFAAVDSSGTRYYYYCCRCCSRLHVGSSQQLLLCRVQPMVAPRVQRLQAHGHRMRTTAEAPATTVLRGAVSTRASVKYVNH